MIITNQQFKKQAYKDVKNHLTKLYPDDFLLSTRNLLFDFVILRFKYDLILKVIFEHEIKNIEQIKKIYKSDKYSQSFINRKFYICYYKNNKQFQLIDLS